MADFGLLSTGFARKPLAVIDAEFEADLRAISPNITLEADDPFAQAAKIFTGKLGEMWELAEAVNASQDPNEAGGQSLDALGALTGTRRDAASTSKVVATVNLDDGTDIEIGDAVASVVGDPNATFKNTEKMVNASGTTGDFQVAFEAEDTGPVVAAAGTLTNIDGGLSGWNTVTNAEDAALGAVIEVDGPYRLRRDQDLAGIGGGTLDGMRADIDALTGITSVRVHENFAGQTDGFGLPSKSFEVVIDGAGFDVQEVADIIWVNKPLGIEPFGSSTQEITDTQGDTHDIGYTVASQIAIDVSAVFSGSPDSAEVNAAYSAILAALEIGDTVFGVDLACDLKLVAGVTSVTEVLIRKGAESFANTVTLSRVQRPILGDTAP